MEIAAFYFCGIKLGMKIHQMDICLAQNIIMNKLMKHCGLGKLCQKMSLDTVLLQPGLPAVMAMLLKDAIAVLRLRLN